MASTQYTGRLETFTDKFTYFVPLTTIFEKQELNVTFRDVTTIPPTDHIGDMDIQKITSKRFEDIFEYPVSEYKQTDQQNDDIDSDLLKLRFLYSQPLSSRSPYKYTSKVLLQVDSISIQTFQLYTDGDPGEVARTDDAYQQFSAFLPITISLNDNQVEFTASDGVNDFQLSEYGEFTSGTLPASVLIHTDQLIPPLIYKGNNYIQSYDTQFELPSFPQSMTITLDVNNNLFAEYYKTQYYRNNSLLRIDKEFFSQLFMTNFRVDFRVITYIDYEDNKISRLVPEKLTYQSIKKLLEQQNEKQTDEKTIEKKARIKRRVKIQLDKELDPELEEQVIKHFTSQNDPSQN